MRRYAAIKAMDGRNVVVGMRSEDIHPANARPELPTLPATVELLEALGSGVMAYLHVDAEPVRTPSAHGSGPEEEPEDEGIAKPNLIAHFPPRIDLSLGDSIPVAVDPETLHFFDEETGAALS